MSTQNRVITVFATQGKGKSKIETDVASWGALKALLSAEGYDLGKLLATESITRHDLINEDAVLPEGDFTVFLRPAKTKSGLDVKDLGFKELRKMVADRKDNVAFMEHVNKKGNYTRLSTDQLRKRLASWKEEEAAPAESSSEGTDTDFSNLTPQEKVDLIVQLAQEVSEDVDNDFTVTVEVEGGDDVDLDAAETEELTKLGEEILAGYKVTLCFCKK